MGNLKVLLMLMVLSTAARAQAERPAVFMMLSGGATWADIKHPSFQGNFAAPTWGLHAGLDVSSVVRVGVGMDGLMRRLHRVRADLYDLSATAANCTNCAPPATAGIANEADATFNALYARVDVSPLGSSGPYVAGIVGLGLADGFPADAEQAGHFGAAVGVRGGYRHRLAQRLEVFVEVGWQGQFYDRATVSTPVAIGGARLFF